MKKKKNTTIRDVAKRADVSYQTVSRVLNDNNNVADETRRRVLQAIEDLNYRPNNAARMLITSRSRTLELITVDVLYGGRLADSTKRMAQAAKEAGYSLLVSETTADELADALESATARLVDGVLLYAPRLQIADEALLEMCRGVPLVRRDYVPGSRIAWVGFDQVHATRLTVEYLINLGHRQIAAIPPTSEILNGYWRYSTWKSVLLEHGLTPGPSFPGDYSMGSGYEAALKIMDSEKPFSALLAGTDNMAVGALRAFRERGVRVPADVSVVSFDNTELSMYIEPPLTTVNFEFERQDAISVRYLVDLINEPDMDLHQRVLTSEMIIRESARALTDDEQGYQD